MSDGTILNLGAGGDTIATEDIAGVKYELVKIGFGSAGVFTRVDATNRLPIALSAADIAAIAPLIIQPVSGTFWQATQPVSGAFFQATQPVSLATNTPDVTDRVGRLLGHVTVDNASLAVTGSVAVTSAGLTNLDVLLSTRLKPADTLAAVTTVTTVSTVTAVSSVNAVVPGTGATNLGKAEDAPHTSGDVGVAALGVRNDLEANLTSADLDYGAIALDTSGRVRTREISNQIATTISTANATVTLTIAAAGAGLFHYITSLEIVNVNPTAAAIVGSAVTLGYTSTNIPGSPAWTAGNALAAGVEKVVERIAYPGGIKTTTANTATTIVAPAIGAGGLCRIIATYYIAP